jgi:hypothetical protein
MRVLLIKQQKLSEIKDATMGWACGRGVRDKKLIHNFCGKTSWYILSWNSRDGRITL